MHRFCFSNSLDQKYLSGFGFLRVKVRVGSNLMFQMSSFRVPDYITNYAWIFNLNACMYLPIHYFLLEIFSNFEIIFLKIRQSFHFPQNQFDLNNFGLNEICPKKTSSLTTAGVKNVDHSYFMAIIIGMFTPFFSCTTTKSTYLPFYNSIQILKVFLGGSQFKNPC